MARKIATGAFIVAGYAGFAVVLGIAIIAAWYGLG